MSRHTNKYGELECAAYLEVARFKWGEDFACKRPGCTSTKYFEGDKPYSRRCSICKKDESPTANTVFEKMRMPLTACLETVRMVMEERRKLTIEEVTQHLINAGHKGVNTKSVWVLLGKIYQTMTAEPRIYGSKALFVAFIGKHQIGLYSYGNIAEKKYRSAFTARDLREVFSLIKKYTQEHTKVCLYSFAGNGSFSRMKLRKVRTDFREAWLLKKTLTIDEDFYSWNKSLECRAYKLNGNEYEDLMVLLTRENKIEEAKITRQ